MSVKFLTDTGSSIDIIDKTPLIGFKARAEKQNFSKKRKNYIHMCQIQ